MKDDFGCFGSGLEGYVQYTEAFKRNFDSVSSPNNIPVEDKPDENKPKYYDDDDEDENNEDEDES